MKLLRRLFIPDVHAPYHDTKAFEIMMSIAKEFRPDEIVIHGDFQDCYTVSAYTKDPLRGSKLLKEEIEEGSGLLRRVQKELKPKRVIYIEGNHEHRIFKYLATNAAKLGGFMETRDLLGIPKDWKWVPWGPKNYHICGKLVATHGTLASRHCAAAMAGKYGASVIFGHTHRIQEFNLRNVYGDRIKGITIGWLGDIHRAAEYVENVADWSHGFALGWFKENGDYFLEVIEIEKYEAIYGGEIYTGPTLRGKK